MLNKNKQLILLMPIQYLNSSQILLYTQQFNQKAHQSYHPVLQIRVMSVFDQGFNYQFTYQVGGTKGWSLNISDALTTDRYNGQSNIILMSVSKQDKTKILLHQYNDGSYHLKIGQGKFVNWFIGMRAHPKRKNVYYLVAQPQAYRDSYWYFDQIKGAAYDNTRVILRNSYEGNFIGVVRDGHYKRDNYSNYIFVYSNNKVSGNWSSWRIQSVGRSPIYQQYIQTNLQQINNLQTKCTTTSKNLQWYENKVEQYTSTIAQKSNENRNSIMNLEEEAKLQIQKTNKLTASINSLEEANRLYLQMKQYRQSQINGLKDNIQILSKQKQFIYQAIQESNDTSTQLNQQLQNVSSDRDQFIQNLTIQKMRQRAEHFQNTIQWAVLHDQHLKKLQDLKSIIFERKEASILQGKIYDQEEQYRLFTDLLQRIQNKNQQCVKQINQGKLKFQQERTAKQKQINSELNLNNSLLQKYVKLKKQLFRLKSKTTYFKFLHKQQVEGQPLDNAMNQLFGASNYEHMLKTQNQQLKERLQILQECFRFHDIEEPPIDNGFLLKQSVVQENQQLQYPINNKSQAQAASKDQDHEQIKKIDVSTPQGRASKKILRMKPNQFVLLNMDDLDQDFETYYSLRLKKQQQRKEKIAKQTHNSQTYHLFDSKLSTQDRLKINQNIATVTTNDYETSLAVCNIQLGVNNFEMAVKINKTGAFVGVGIYNVKKNLQQFSHNIGKYNPQSDNYYFLTNTGKFLFNDEISPQEQKTHFKFGTGSKLTFRYDAAVKIISLEIQNKEGQKQTVNFVVKLWHQKSFRVAFLLKGANCSIATAKTIQDLHSYNQYGNMNSQVILKCAKKHILQNQESTQNYKICCSACSEVLKIGDRYYKCQQCESPSGLCANCAQKLKQKSRVIRDIERKCQKCISDQIMSVGESFFYDCCKCKRKGLTQWQLPGMNCKNCYTDVCYDCVIAEVQ